ncbi:hypothetical protein LLG95_09780 [bacterium]|nr:hypothetical protein [bacterium]
MLEILRQLKDLTEVDRAIVEARNQLAKYPRTLEQLKQAQDRLSAQLKEFQDQLEKARQERRHAEKEVASLRQQISKYIDQQAQVKTNKEYQAMSHEIEQLQGRIDEWDTVGLEKLEIEDTCQRELEKMKAAMQTQRAEQEAQSKRIEELTREKKAFIEKLAVDRERLFEQLPDPFRDDYEILQDRFPGTACMPIEGEQCSGCNWHLVLQTRQAAKTGGEPARCEHCRRFLYSPES